MAKQNGSSSKLADPHGEAKWPQLRAGQLEMLKSRGRKGQKRPIEAPPFLRCSFALSPLPGRSMRNVKTVLPPAFGEAAVSPRKISFALTPIRHTRLYNVKSIFGTHTQTRISSPNRLYNYTNIQIPLNRKGLRLILFDGYRTISQTKRPPSRMNRAATK